MCILFSYLSRNLRENQFKLILLSNRDEYHHRPSQPASFVQDNVYGVDLTPGKEGGTWLGMSRRSPKLAALLNVHLPKATASTPKSGRGFMVPNFLNSNLNASSFAETLKPSADLFDPFNLVLFEGNQKKQLWNATIFDTVDKNHQPVDSEFVSISNHPYTKPYPKTIYGQNIFQDIVNNYNSVSKQDDLIANLLKLAKHDGGVVFDRSILGDIEKVRHFTRQQVYVNIPSYSTRTHTIVLVDDKDTVTFYEKTIKYPIDADKPDWLESKFEFKFE